MSDKFLYSSRPPVRKEFADQLYQHLNEIKFEKNTQQYTRLRNKRNSKWNYAFIAFFFIIFLLFTFSRGARVSASGIIQNIAGFFVKEWTLSPLGQIENNLSENESRSPLSKITETFYSTISLEDFIAKTPFKFELPTYIPDGFKLQQNEIAKEGDWVSLVWKKKNAEIELLVEKSSPVIPSGPNSAEEISINGTSALLIQGWWDENRIWDPLRGLEIHWNKNNLHYRLIYSQRLSSDRTIQPITGDIEEIIRDLSKMAESIP